ncbi:MAG: hypothetical protein LC791_08860 [Acidobacteria bacterium]|nr:hypothetical protein [Acidobacteriota bacterium]
MRVSPDDLRFHPLRLGKLRALPEHGRQHADVAHLLGAHLRTRESARL